MSVRACWSSLAPDSLATKQGLPVLLAVLVPSVVGAVGVQCLLGLIEPAGVLTALTGLLAIGCSALGFLLDVVWLQRPVGAAHDLEAPAESDA